MIDFTPAVETIGTMTFKGISAVLDHAAASIAEATDHGHGYIETAVRATMR